MRRVPLLLTLVPLALAIGLYWLLWSGWANAFKAQVGGWLPGSAVTISGFPYRLEASADAPKLSGGGTIALSASAEQAAVNRGPWQKELTVIRTVRPQFTAAAGGLAATGPLRVDAGGLSALTSVHVIDGKLVRLSTVIEAARVHLGLLTPLLAADTLEVHLREVPGRLPEPWSATLPARGQAVVSAQRLRIGGGDALTLAADVAVTGSARLTDFARWADGGTVEVGSLTLADAHGEVAKLVATLVPQGLTSVRIAGTIDTVCPEAVKAAFDRVAPPRALRLRAPVRLALEADIGAVRTLRLSGMPADLASRARRTQLPVCPVFRGV